jgi:hypothetical protein
LGWELNLLQTINFNITLSAPVGFDIKEKKQISGKE